MRKAEDVKQEKDETREKDVDAVVTDPDPSRDTGTIIPTANPETQIQEQKEKAKAETKKANKHPDLVPLAIVSRKIHAATAAVTITLPAPATNDRTTRKMARINHHTNKQISM
jgi:hypothetical protein